MRGHLTVLAALAVALVSHPATARTCFTVSSEVVSLGETNARAYATRSLDQSIVARKTSLESSGRKVGKVARNEMECAPYPNLIGAEEWVCKGRAQVCATD